LQIDVKSSCLAAGKTGVSLVGGQPLSPRKYKLIEAQTTEVHFIFSSNKVTQLVSNYCFIDNNLK
jgi:hypothetical protein